MLSLFCHMHLSIDQVFVNRERIVFESRLFLFLPLLPQVVERIGGPRILAGGRLHSPVRAAVAMLACGLTVDADAAAGRRRHEIVDTDISSPSSFAASQTSLSFIPAARPASISSQAQVTCPILVAGSDRREGAQVDQVRS